ncbi:hypothetical protein COLO4_32069 [Corchorus olitorius]|uniref:Uncharacterized protein n=1 Tax=Corchorus olitorius TaxID=93759 RepID=A0A1R3H1Y3_9ROSI|nr:hypothetical protein COLO4_32069 [Corchorus olitorius]
MLLGARNFSVARTFLTSDAVVVDIKEPEPDAPMNNPVHYAFLLHHKTPLIEELEEHMQKLNEERASAVLERRIANNDDEMVEVETAMKAEMLLFKERGNNVVAIEYAAKEAQAASDRGQANLPVKLDDFGYSNMQPNSIEEYYSSYSRFPLNPEIPTTLLSNVYYQYALYKYKFIISNSLFPKIRSKTPAQLTSNLIEFGP